MIKIIRARLAEIVMLCMEEVKRSGYAEQLRAGIVVTGGASRIADFEQFLAQETGMSIRFGSFVHYLDVKSAEKYSDTEYTLLVGLLLNATEVCIQERKVEEPEKNQPIAPKKDKKSSSWKDLFNAKVGNLFDAPEEPTIK